MNADLENMLVAGFETAFNAWMSADPDALMRLNPLVGRIINMYVRDMDLTLTLVPTDSGMHVLRAYQDKPDTQISATLATFFTLASKPSRRKTLLASGQLRIRGNLLVAARFSRWLAGHQADWEALLAGLIGDIAAHAVHGRSSQWSEWVGTTIKALEQDLVEYLQEESRQLPVDWEVEDWLSKVDTLRHDADRLQARMKRLLSRVELS